MNIKKTIITTLALSSLLLGLTGCGSMGGGSSDSSSSSLSSAEKNEEVDKIAKEYKNVVVAFIYAKAYSAFSVGDNDKANSLLVQGTTLKEDDNATIEDSTAALDASGAGDMSEKPKTLSEDAKNYFKKSVGFLSFAVAQETLLVNLVSDVAKNAQAQIESASFMQKPKLISQFKPVLDLATRLPNDLKITAATLADYIDYARNNAITLEELDGCTAEAEATF